MTFLGFIMAIGSICLNDIDPKFDKYRCVSHIITCNKVENKPLDDCLEFWEPLRVEEEDNYEYFGDPAEADLSY